MAAPACLSPLELVLEQRVLARVKTSHVPRRPGPVVVVLYPGEGAPEEGPPDHRTGARGATTEHGVQDRDDDRSGAGSESAGAGALEAMRALAADRARTEAQMVAVAKDVVAQTGAVLLAEKGFASVEELSATARRKWRAEAKATAVAELQVALGMGVMAARRLVGLGCAPARARSTVVGALERGEASLDMALRFWDRCARLDEQDGADVAGALFGTDADTAVPERLDPKGDLLERPWHAGEYDAALEREALRREGRDEEGRREQRRRARAARDAAMRVHDDGTATLSIQCAVTTGAGVYQRIDRASRALRGAGDPRTLAQLRSDVACALLLHGTLPLPGTPHTGTRGPGAGADDGGGQAGGRSGAQEAFDLGNDDLVSPADLLEIGRILAAAPPVQLQVVIPWDSLTGRPAGAAFCPAPCCSTPAIETAGTTTGSAGTGTSTGPPGTSTGPPGATARPPGTATGPPGRNGQAKSRGAVGQILGVEHGFITPEHVRALAMQPGTTLARLLVDPADGRLVERTIASYRPDAAMRRQVRAADVTSRAPGSTRPAAWCDLDHEHPWADGGLTSETNLNCKDRRSHTFKTKGWWTTTMAPNRDVTWTTLLGQTQTTRAHDYRQYLDAAVPVVPDQDEVHPSRRTDREDRLDLAGQALYAALVHRGPHALLADPDDAHGATEHHPTLGGWIWVSHTNRDGIRRHGPPPDHPTVADILGLPTVDEPEQDRTQGKGADDPAAGTPWSRHAADDDKPPF